MEILERRIILDGIADVVIGKQLGKGQTRTAYAYLPDPDKYVIKLQHTEHSSDNVLEWEIWHSLRDTKWAKWFAPCVSCSINGMALVQERVTPICDLHYEMGLVPKRVPFFFTDLKKENFGFIGKQFVCCDYAYSLDRFIDKSLLHTKEQSNMQKLEFWR